MGWVGVGVFLGGGNLPSPTRRMRSEGVKGMIGGGGVGWDAGFLAAGGGFAVGFGDLGGCLEEGFGAFCRFVLGIVRVHMVGRVYDALKLEVRTGVRGRGGGVPPPLTFTGEIFCQTPLSHRSSSAAIT